MIALPYVKPGANVPPLISGQKSDFRLLLNQFNETLKFTFLDKGVPNRGAATKVIFDADQHLAALQYIQHIRQLMATDFPQTRDTNDTPKGPSNTKQAIRHEPGLLLHLLNAANPFIIARLGTIPHGDAVLAMGGDAKVTNGPPDLAALGDFGALPIGVNQDLNKDAYLAPYKRFHDAPFKGNVKAPGFPGFDPTQPIKPLQGAIVGLNIVKTTTLVFDTANPTSGISNIPFVTNQANATAVKAIFWIEELAKVRGKPREFLLQYAQRVLLDFFPTPADPSKQIRWPHITINTMKFIGDPDA